MSYFVSSQSPYLFNGPLYGDVQSPSVFTITLKSSSVSSVIVTPSSSNGDGSFSPSSVTLSQSSKSATITYTPTIVGPRNITVSNNLGLIDPPGISYTSCVQTGSSSTWPLGSNNPSIGSFDIFSSGPWFNQMATDISANPVHPWSNSVVAAIAGGRKIQMGDMSGDMGGIPYNIVDSSQPKITVTSGSVSDTDIPGQTSGSVQAPFFDTEVQEGLPLRNWLTGTANLSNGSQLVTGTGTNFTHLKSGQTIRFANEQTEYIVNIIDDTNMSIIPAYQGVLTSTSSIWGPRNFPSSLPAGDHHVSVWVRDKDKITDIYEAYQLYKDINGNIVSSYYSHWNLTTGQSLPLSRPTCDAAGMALSPILIRYDEIASGAINHTVRGCLNSVMGSGLAYPGKQVAGSGIPYFKWSTTGIPAGARLRLKSSFDISIYTNPVQVLLQCLKTYGVIQADNEGISGFHLEGSFDPRWTSTDYNQLNSISVDNFELIDIPPFIQFSAATSVTTGTTLTITGTASYPDDNGTGLNCYTSYSRNNPSYAGTGGTGFTGFSFNPGSWLPKTASFIPASDGLYAISGQYGGYYYYSPCILVVAKSSNSAWTTTQSGEWSIDSSQPTSPWYDGGAQTALARVPDNGDTATIAIGHSVTLSATWGRSDGTRVVNNRTIGNGSGTALTINGSLAITGCTLTVQGALSGNAPTLANWGYQIGQLA